MHSLNSFNAKMWLTLTYLLLMLNLSSFKCDDENVELKNEIEYLTVKYGNTSEIRFQIKDPKSHLQVTQLEMIRMEQIRQGALLDELVDKVHALASLEPSHYASSCAEATAVTRRSGVYQIRIPGYSVHPFIVSCDEDTQGGAWTTILRREDGSVDFFLYWKDYKMGFGNPIDEFFIGLDKLHIMTKAVAQELIITMEDFNGQHRYAKYDRFAIGDEEQAYKLQELGKYSGDAGDSLRTHVGFKFTTRDRDNDPHKNNCAVMYTGAWWYNQCHASNLMGLYNETQFGKGINWLAFTTHTASLKRVKMMIRPRRS